MKVLKKEIESNAVTDNIHFNSELPYWTGF